MKRTNTNISNQQKQVVFCDFDGTITSVETFVGMIKTFAPELAQKILPQIYDHKLTLKMGVRKILESMPSALYPDILNYAERQDIRPGLKDFLDFLQIQNIPCVVISGGLKVMIEIVLDRHNIRDKITDIWAVEIDNSQEYFQINSPVEGEVEFVDKGQIMDRYPGGQTIAIGDGITDVGMALKADVIFARDRLRDYLELENKSYIPWHDFFEIKGHWEDKMI